MCGIIGYTGSLDASHVLLKGLTELEYRGYDSAGIALFQNTQEGEKIETIKTAGKVSCLVDKVKKLQPALSHCGIGHTRWATHGGVCDKNAHPHTAGKVTLLHNGIIENYHRLQQQFAGEGLYPISETDTEIAAMVINQQYHGDPYQAIWNAVALLEGSYAFCILFEDHPGEIYSIRKGSPLVAASLKDGGMVASDMIALISYTKDYFVVPENTILTLSAKGLSLTNEKKEEITPELLHVSWDVSAAKKGGYDYFMLKEIFDQPEALRNTILPRIRNGVPNFQEDGIPDSLFLQCKRVVFSACGTAMHACLLGQTLLERLLRIPATVEIASEYQYKNPILDEDTLLITISQSGETADSRAVVELAKSRGAKTLSIVNVKGSTIARESDYVLYSHAGPEISVASTKAYSVQLACLYLIAFHWAEISKTCTHSQVEEYTTSLLELPKLVSEILTHKEDMANIADRIKSCEDLFFIGRGLDYALSCEGSLKLKEVSYVHSEAYAAGELKHGTISLITNNVPVIALATQANVYDKMVSNIKEVRARGALVILITSQNAPVEDNLCDHQIRIPEVSDIFAPLCAIPILQLLAYYTGIKRGVNVDQPRNLAKSVTVE